MEQMATVAHKAGGASSTATVNVDQFLVDFADALNTTLDLDTLLNRVAEMVRTVIPYEIFAIFLVNEKNQDLRIRFQIGHAPEVERLKIRIGQGVTGSAVQRREIVLVNDVTKDSNYINGHPGVRSELAVPLIAKDKVIGVIDIQSNEIGYFREEHRKLMSLVASRIAVAIENARLYTRVYRQAQTLQILNEISRELTSILNLDQLLARIGELTNRVIDYQMFSILLVEENTQMLQHRFSLRFKENIQLKHHIPLGRGLVGAAAQTRQTVLVPDVSKDPRYIMLNPETRSELAVPLIYKNKVIGVLDIEHTRRGYFNEDHVRTMTTLAAQIAVAIENARLYERIAREEQRLERDLAMAREVQQHLLPQCCPELQCADVAARFVPAQAIGGDIYDFIPYSGGRTAMTVGDVSGKGAPAALFGALVSGIMRSTAGMEPSPSEMLAAINTSLNERRIEARYVSIVYAIWDDERHVMLIANSGQPRPIYCHHGKTQIVEAAGLPLGLLEDTDYDEVTINAHPGDVFVLFSDGIIDAQNAQEDLFGRPRLEDVVRKHHEHSAEQIVDAIFSAVDSFSAGVAAFDDETVLVIKIRPGVHTHDAADAARKKRSKTSGALRNI
jgi:phosphoserine phosphatase RsbU/P